VSAYRPYTGPGDTQSGAFDNAYNVAGNCSPCAQKDHCLLANKFSALPGHSEHQTGDALDFAGDDTIFMRRGSPPYNWLESNACAYGFVQSYALGKSHVTGYVEEPWHWRYVGVARAKAMRHFNAGNTPPCAAADYSLEEHFRDHPDDAITSLPSQFPCPIVSGGATSGAAICIQILDGPNGANLPTTRPPPLSCPGSIQPGQTVPIQGSPF
jgi:hypothetical protein